MSDFEQAPVVPQEQMTVVELRVRVKRIRQQLAHVSGAIAGVEAWCTQVLPGHHVPTGEPVLVRELVQTTAEDLDVLQRDVQDVADLLAQSAGTVERLRADVLAHAGSFAPEGGWAASDAAATDSVQVTAHLGGDQEQFEQQRQAVRRALAFDTATSTWRGRLPVRVSQQPDSWRALVDAAEAGADVKIHS
jgi:phage FluMu protein gp41